jgi:1-acyl-sn-glycerol-3-phosphate acyltransferase
MFEVILKYIRRTFITIWFWLGASIATLLTGFCVFVSGAKTHDSITYYIEHVMAAFILQWMIIPGFWKVKFSTVSERKDVENTTKSTLEDVSSRMSSHGSKTKPGFGPFILAANHNSIIDTLFMALLPFHKTYTYNAKWSFVPVFGKMCQKAGYVAIVANDPVKRKNAIPDTVKKIRDGYSVMYYPQGTRSKTPKLDIKPEDLKHGAFTIAVDSKAEILPIRIKGSHKILRRWGVADVGTVEVVTGRNFMVADVETGKEAYCKAMNSM